MKPMVDYPSIERVGEEGGRVLSWTPRSSEPPTSFWGDKIRAWLRLIEGVRIGKK